MDQSIKMNLMYAHNIIVNHLEGKAKQLVKNKTFIAGGAIRSLYNDKDINDYDLYFTDAESASEFKTLISNGLNEGIPFSNVDEMRLNFRACTENAITFYIEEIQKNVQFILKYSGQPIFVIKKFDFTNSMAYYEPQTNFLLLTEDFKIANNSKILIFNNDSYSPAVSFERMLKFSKQGYNIPRSTVLNLIETIASLPKEKKDEYLTGKGYYA